MSLIFIENTRNPAKEDTKNPNQNNKRTKNASRKQTQMWEFRIDDRKTNTRGTS